MKKLILFAAVMVTFVASAQASTFVNGGFEDNSFDGWTKGGGEYYGYYVPGGDPGKSAIVSTGKDYYSGNALDMVYNGNHAARINNYDWGYHYSTLTQQVLNWTDPKIYFEWAAVLEDPGHTEAGHFSINLTDNTNGAVLYAKAFDYYTAPGVVAGGWLDGVYGWKYSKWQDVELDTSSAIGHNLTLTLLASDCGWGGHGGYAYLDGFGATHVDPGPAVPEPSTILLLGAGLLGMAIFGKRRMNKA